MKLKYFSKWRNKFVEYNAQTTIQSKLHDFESGYKMKIGNRLITDKDEIV